MDGGIGDEEDGRGQQAVSRSLSLMDESDENYDGVGASERPPARHAQIHI